MAFAVAATWTLQELPRLHAEPAKLFPAKLTHVRTCYLGYAKTVEYNVDLAELNGMICDLYVTESPFLRAYGSP